MRTLKLLESRRYLYVRLFVTSMMLFFGCNKKIVNWKPNILGPIIGGNISVESLSDIKNKHFNQTILPINIGYLPGAYNVPPLYIKHVGPFNYGLSDYFSFASVDSASLTITFSNQFPITVGKGTRIVFRSSPDTNSVSNIIYSHTVVRDIPTDSTYFFNTILRNTTVYNNLYLSVDSFLSPGGKVTFSNNPTVIDFKINVIRVNKVGIFTNRSYTYWDSTNLDLASNSATKNLNDSSASGTVRTFITNLIPANVTTQIFFYDANHQLIDSLYHGVLFDPAATTDSTSGSPLSSIEKKFDFPINAKRINNIRKTKTVKYRVKGDTYGLPGKTVVAAKATGVNVHIISDMMINLGNLLNKHS